MARDLGLYDVVDHFTMIGDELDQLRNRSGATRLGFAVLLKCRGHAKATVATAHKILTAAYHVLDQGAAYHELGEEFFYRRDTENTERYRRRLIRQLERPGHQVTLDAPHKPPDQPSQQQRFRFRTG